jgi:hypothetical protein
VHRVERRLVEPQRAHERPDGSASATGAEAGSGRSARCCGWGRSTRDDLIADGNNGQINIADPRLVLVAAKTRDDKRPAEISIAFLVNRNLGVAGVNAAEPFLLFPVVAANDREIDLNFSSIAARLRIRAMPDQSALGSVARFEPRPEQPRSMI